ncbi:MAG: PQQ-like beta-propeller repeat protein [Campylobacterales bacterium]|nr:PQQ-like beta-propeller repeat protein [Campylobacterales bacterium]
MKYLILLVSLLFIFQACSSKKYYQAEKTYSLDSKVKFLSSEITSFNKTGASLDDNTVITKEGILKNKIPKNFSFINYSNNKIIASNKKDKIYLDNKILDLNKHVVAAAVNDSVLALILSDNSLEIYNLEKDKIVFKEYLDKSLVNDVRIANPIFIGDLILFPTLDGKILIVNFKTNKIINSITLDVDGKFNNLIFLKVVDKNLIAATANKVISLSSTNRIIKNFEIRDIISNNNDIYIATIDGKIIQLNNTLEIINMKKYNYAKFYTLAYGENLYALESQDYLISLSKDFKEEKIYDFSFDEDSKVISIKNTIYFDNKYIILK